MGNIKILSMKKRWYFICYSLVCMFVTSCRTDTLAPGYELDEIRNVVVLQPSCDAFTIDGKGDAHNNMELGNVLQEKFLDAIKTNDFGLCVDSLYVPRNFDENYTLKQSIFEMYYQYGKVDDSNIVPPALTDIIASTGSRYGAVIYYYTYSMTWGRFIVENLKSIMKGLLTLGTNVTVVYKKGATCHAFIIDSERQRVVWHNELIFRDVLNHNVDRELEEIFMAFKKHTK